MVSPPQQESLLTLKCHVVPGSRGHPLAYLEGLTLPAFLDPEGWIASCYLESGEAGKGFNAREAAQGNVADGPVSRMWLGTAVDSPGDNFGTTVRAIID